MDKFFKDKKGAAALTFALTLPIFIGALVLLVEVGFWHQKQSKLQNIADMAAIAAAREMIITKDNTLAKAAATGDASANGFDFSRGTVTATTDIPDGPYAGKRGIRVTVRKQQPLFFSNYFLGERGKRLNQTVEATALLTGSGDPVCAITLGDDPSLSYKGFVVQGSSSVTMGDCTILSNNPSPASVDVSGRGYLEVGCVQAAGGVDADSEDLKLNVCDAPDAYADPIVDPYLYLSLPPEASEPCKTAKLESKTKVELEPGRYCKYFSPSDSVTLTKPGTYVFDAISATAGIGFKGSSATFTGSEVTIVLMNDAKLNLSGSYANLTAPTSGPFKGILIYNDPDSGTFMESHSVTANGTSRFEGVLYYPTAVLSYAGGSTIEGECTSVVAQRITFTGNSELNASGCTKYGVGSTGGSDGVAIFQ